MDRHGTLKIVKNVRICWTSYMFVSAIKCALHILPFLGAIHLYHLKAAEVPSNEKLRLQVSEISMNLMEHHMVKREGYSLWDLYVTDTRKLHDYTSSSSERKAYFHYSWLESELFMAYVCWSSYKLLVTICTKHLLITLKSALDVTNTFVMKISRKRWTVYVILVALYSCLLVMGLEGAALELYKLVSHNLKEWIDNSVVEVTVDDKGALESVQLGIHPLTKGNTAPFLLQKHYRYSKEDAVFNCEYLVMGEAGIEPIRTTSWWRKDGKAIVNSNRHFINVSVEAMGKDFVEGKPVAIFKIKSTLTIAMIEDGDYGRYACSYINPIPWKILVVPHLNTEISNPSRKRKDGVHNSASKVGEETNKCDHEKHEGEPVHCESEKDDEGKEDVLIGPQPQYECQPNDRNGLTSQTVCFAEFELRRQPMENKTVVRNVTQGGIFIDQVEYMTQADVEDLLIDASFQEESQLLGNRECCSMFVKLYWIFFRKGAFIDLPVSRVISSPNMFLNIGSTYAKRWMCVCDSSFRTHDFTMYRHFYSNRRNKTETIEIKYPVKVKLEPLDKNITPLSHSLSVCSGSQNSSTLCYAVNNVLINPYYTFYAYDIVFLVIFVVAALLVWVFIKWPRRYIAKPLQATCFYLFYPTRNEFPALRGASSVKPRAIEPTTHSNQIMDYDIYLSYNEEENYDANVATFIKKILNEMELSVFDPRSDILPGHLIQVDMSMAINQSHRFVVLASKSYASNDMKKLELSYIQESIVSQKTRPQDRMIVLLLEPCRSEIRFLSRVPYIEVEEGMKEQSRLDEHSVNRFKEWEASTRPRSLGPSPHISVLQQLRLFGVRVKSLLILLILLYLSSKSSLFVNTDDSDEMPALET